LQAKEPQGNKGNVDFIIKPGRADGSKKKKNPAEIKNEILPSHCLQ